MFLSPAAADFAARFPGAVDSHAHVFGPAARFPYASESRYIPEQASSRMHLAMLDGLGFARGVLVQGSAHGLDNAAMLAALDLAPDRLRGVAVVHGDTPVDVLLTLRQRNVRGLRFFSDADKRYDGRVSLAAACASSLALQCTRMHVQLLASLPDIDDASIRQLAAAGIPVVIDHFGHVDTATDTGHWAFRRLGDWLANGLVWVKLSAVYRLCRDTDDGADVRPFHQALLDANPDRLLWGTDWPHPNFSGPVPDTAGLLARFLDWTPEPQARKILVDNPAALFEF